VCIVDDEQAARFEQPSPFQVIGIQVRYPDTDTSACIDEVKAVVAQCFDLRHIRAYEGNIQAKMPGAFPGCIKLRLGDIHRGDLRAHSGQAENGQIITAGQDSGLFAS